MKLFHMVMSQTLHECEERKVNSKTKLAKVVLLVHDTSSRFNLSVKFHEYVSYVLGDMSRIRRGVNSKTELPSCIPCSRHIVSI